ncbi:MAG: hypothetical protein HRU02_04455 [Myxococcales bacterium]|nr:hypothetical protein [Myxococcales bacterium]
MTKTNSLAVGTVLALSVALPGLAETGAEEAAAERPAASRQEVWADSQTALMAGIELTADQQSEIEALDAKFEAEIDERHKKRSQLRRDLSSAQDAGKISEAKRIRSQLREMRREPGRRAQLTAIREVLDEKQRVSFDENRKAFRDKAQQERTRVKRERPDRPAPAKAESPAEEEAPVEGDSEP